MKLLLTTIIILNLTTLMLVADKAVAAQAYTCSSLFEKQVYTSKEQLSEELLEQTMQVARFELETHSIRNYIVRNNRLEEVNEKIQELHSVGVTQKLYAKIKSEVQRGVLNFARKRQRQLRAQEEVSRPFIEAQKLESEMLEKYDSANITEVVFRAYYNIRDGLYVEVAKQDIYRIFENEILRERVDVNARDDDGWTAFMLAAEEGHKEVVELLLRQPNIDVNAKAENDWTALMWASWYGHKDVVELLLKQSSVDVNAKDEKNKTALMLAAERDYREMVELLLRQPNIDVNARDKDHNKTALMWASWYGHKDVVKLLKAHGVKK